MKKKKEKKKESKALVKASGKAIEKVDQNGVSESTIKDYLFGSDTKLDEQQQKFFIGTALALKLNPFKREIYPIPYEIKEYDPVQKKKIATGKYRLSIVTGYEVYLKKAERSGRLIGWKAWSEGTTTSDLKACIEIHRRDFRSAFYHEVYFREYDQANEMWIRKPHTMIKKVCIAQGFRLAFPEDLDGIPYIPEELGREEVNSKTIEGSAELEKQIENSPNQKPSLPPPASDQGSRSPASQPPAQKPPIPPNPAKAQPLPPSGSPANPPAELLDLDISSPQKTIPIGKFKDQKYIDLPYSYIKWLRDKVKNPGQVEALMLTKLDLLYQDYSVRSGATEGDLECVIKKQTGKIQFWDSLSMEQKEKVVSVLHDEAKRKEKGE